MGIAVLMLPGWLGRLPGAAWRALEILSESRLIDGMGKSTVLGTLFLTGCAGRPLVSESASSESTPQQSTKKIRVVLVGIVAGYRLAWQWGRLLGLVGGIVLTLAAIRVFSQAGGWAGPLIVATLIALQGVPLLPMFFAFGTRQARQHLRLICPQCGCRKSKGGNFLSTKAICKECRATWQ
jgi:hypothetical protein